MDLHIFAGPGYTFYNVMLYWQNRPKIITNSKFERTFAKNFRQAMTYFSIFYNIGMSEGLT